MTNKSDLISREALKKAIKEDLAEGDNSVNLEYCNAMETALDIIDNAPTVPNEYMRGYEAAEREYKRPQGEWITRHKLNSFGQDVVCFECNKCGEYKVPLYHLLITEPLKVCPNCGADMRKGGAENDT